MFGQPVEICGYQFLFRETGYYITRREQFEHALQSFDIAVEKTPEDRRALMGRSIARAKAVQYEGAMADINKALTLFPDDLVLLALKALNTYLSCDFEEALVQNLRCLPLRKKPDNFYMGVMHCTQAIENGIGEFAGRPLRDHFKIIRKLAWKKAFEAENPVKYVARNKKKKKKPKEDKGKKQVLEPLALIKYLQSKKTRKEVHYQCGEEPEGYEVEIRDSLRSHRAEDEFIPKGPRFPYRPLQRYTSNIENFMAEKYLNSMYLDKIFLKTLKDNPGVSSPNRDGYKHILQLAKDGYKMLSYKQELLRTRRPFYFIKFAETLLSKRLLERLEAEKQYIRERTETKADYLLNKMKTHINKRETKFALDTAEKIKAFCEEKPRKYLPAKDSILEEVCVLVGNAYLDMKRLNLNQSDADQIKRINNMLGLPISREPSQDSILKQFKGVFIDWRKQITIAEVRLLNSTSQLEVAWLYHDLAKYHAELKLFELARVYARKCIVEAKLSENIPWIINAKMIIAKINMCQHNRTDARTEVNAALELSKQLDNDQLTQYIERTLGVVETTEFEDIFGMKLVEQRENQILTMMAASGMKDEVAHLFRQMAVMPASRRMSVMPGVRFTDTKKVNKNKKMSILPQQKTSDDDFPMRKGKGEKKENKVGFIEMLQD
ncbi:outer dynein arm-docking complex subunit 4-like [Onthophagus taurus]|uniref:outer dynein arm-docking complex subunit 4-like n=1 Tax=Onthophagus taurus TaxID=166361 RepID=UPI000C2086C5|nr:tetratricopeptide repeat protein 25-like [Onthophagus taurus]